MMKELPKPFLGRLLLKTLREDKLDYKLGDKFTYSTNDQGEKVSAGGLIIPDADPRSKTPIRKGEIVDMAEDAYGKAFQDTYGVLQNTPKIGDIVMFVPNNQSNVDPHGKYCLISDDHVLGICN